MKIKNLFAIISLTLLMMSNYANAQISVNRSVIEFSTQEKVQDIEIQNTGDFKIYLDMKVAEIINPESESPQRMELDDPRTASVLVSPTQLLIPPGQRKRVRIILRTPATEVDKVYRLSVKPYTGKLKLGETGEGKKSSAIKVLVGYDLLLLSRPAKINPKIDVTRTAEKIEFSNKGNTNVLLRKIVQCDKGSIDCVDIQPNRLYAGETYTVALPKPGPASQTPVQVWQSVGLENSTETY